MVWLLLRGTASLAVAVHALASSLAASPHYWLFCGKKNHLGAPTRASLLIGVVADDAADDDDKDHREHCDDLVVPTPGGRGSVM